MVKEVHAAHILCKTEKKAIEVKEKLAQGGQSFAEMARKYSQCPSGKSGGDLGWFGKGRMVPEFEKAAFEGEKGKILGPVKTQFGYHLIRLDGVRAAQNLPPFEQVKGMLAEKLEQDKVQAMQQAIIDQARIR